MKKTNLLILLSICMIFLLTACRSSMGKTPEEKYEGLDESWNGQVMVDDKLYFYTSYEKPQVSKDTNLGADLPFIHYESEHEIIFSHAFGIFIYDLDNSKMTGSIKLSDSNFHVGAQGDATAVVQVDEEKQYITIYEVGSKPLDYYYKYDINKDKLYKCSIEELDKDIKQSKITGEMNTTNWSAWDLSYTSKLTDEIYYPLRDIIE